MIPTLLNNWLQDLKDQQVVKKTRVTTKADVEQNSLERKAEKFAKCIEHNTGDVHVEASLQ